MLIKWVSRFFIRFSKQGGFDDSHSNDEVYNQKAKNCFAARPPSPPEAEKERG